MELGSGHGIAFNEGLVTCSVHYITMVFDQRCLGWTMVPSVKLDATCGPRSHQYTSAEVYLDLSNDMVSSNYFNVGGVFC